MTTLANRAAVHAALGEPIRLALADKLVAGDASPSDLAESLDLGTNLLAHHLKVLESAGVIRRVRSEGDRRRSYVQLRFDNPIVRASLARQATAEPPRRVLFDDVMLVTDCDAMSNMLTTASGTRP